MSSTLTVPPSSRPEQPSEVLHPADLELTRRVLDGDAEAWSFFVERYAGLILAMARRYLNSRDTDDIRAVFTSVLESLWRSKLRTYGGRAALSTWLTLVTRSEVVDFLRRRLGRDHAALSRLEPDDREIYRLYYVEGLPVHEVLSHLEGGTWSVDRLIDALHRIERTLGHRWLKRLAYDLHAQSVGAASGRLLEYLDHVRVEYWESSSAQSPEYALIEREAQRTAEQVQASVASLRPRDRQIMQLRFEQGWTARRIAEELGMKGQRSVYKAIDRIVTRLRRLLGRME